MCIKVSIDKKKMVFVKEAQNIFQLFVELWINHYLSKQMPASE